MTPERWQKVEAVLQDALDRSPPERASFIDEACAGDHELKAEATSLITSYEEAVDFIEQPAIVEDAHILLGGDIDDNLGREIGPYKIIERLGAGGMGEVYLAQDTRLGRRVALKLLPSYFASDDARLRRFQSEARAASALNHPNILTIHEVGEYDGIYFIATEFIDGQTIRELIREQKLSFADILDCVEQVASALAAAHAAGIVHRDIKPENIMRRGDGLVKILDFGIAKLMEPETSDRFIETGGLRMQTEAGLVMGTANYMSPEQARGLPVDERTDIWSLGVVLYEMLTQRLPFSGATRMDTMVAILDREPAPLSEISNLKSEISNPHYSSVLMQAVVAKCLSKEMADRYRTVSELIAGLKTTREQLNAPSSQTQSINPLPRRVWPVLAIVLLLSAATVGTILYRRTRVPNTSAASESPRKPYSQMSESERLEFVAAQEHRISTMMSDRAVKLNDDAVRAIKPYVDRYAANINATTNQPPGDLGVVFARARPYVPLIARSFEARKVPVIIGIYLPVIESGYRHCFESDLGAKGLFQLVPATAKAYGVPREEMCDAEKMTPAAAHYIADRMAELGEDSDSVTLVLLSYNRGSEWVRDTLRQLRGSENYERNFWTLLANSETLDESFRKESAGYVPSFFAVAIIGENPEAFGLQMPPLSSLAFQPA
ncbi:MAG TPA: serine/threonine-protein kinase [Pyrinomonadaceae bacterium]|nr:serine/threonine-protein kinase [Pyrinomonadaceae bacterium]